MIDLSFIFSRFAMFLMSFPPNSINDPTETKSQIIRINAINEMNIVNLIAVLSTKNWVNIFRSNSSGLTKVISATNAAIPLKITAIKPEFSLFSMGPLSHSGSKTEIGLK